METSLWLGMVVIMLLQLLCIVGLNRAADAIRELKRTIAHIDATRQARVKGTYADRRTPGVDAEAKTRYRYPRDRRGARMGQAVERKPSHGREPDHD